MPIQLPDINPDKINNLDECKQSLKQVLNFCETLLKEREQLQEKIILLEKEVARLKQQPGKPQFPQKQQSFSATKLLKKDKHWHKSSKKGSIEVDQDMQMPEVERCICGSTNFTTLQTTTKIVQGMIIKRNNTAYHKKKRNVSNVEKYTSPKYPRM